MSTIPAMSRYAGAWLFVVALIALARFLFWFFS